MTERPAALWPSAKRGLRASLLRAATGVLVIALAGCPPADRESRAAEALDLRHRDAWQAARSWLDRLEVDPVALSRRGERGKKKLAEILSAYLYLLRYSTDSSEQPRLLRRVRGLAEQAERPEYHNMLRCDLREFNQNRMSYLRVAWLLEQLGQDTRLYRAQLAQLLPRLERAIAERPPAQPAWLAAYYDHFGWSKPATLRAPVRGVVAERLPEARYRRATGYALTHEVSAAFRQGLRRTQDVFDRGDLLYLRQVLPALVIRFALRKDLDLVAELVSSMTYLELHALPAYRTGIDLLLGSQNANGSWGDYERHRATYGDDVDQKFYLHTTTVTLRALLEAHEDAWLRTPSNASP